MTLIVGMKAADAIILAADSRGTVGDPRGLTAINDKYEKLYSIGNCGVAFAGASELGMTLLDELRKRNIGSITSIDKAVDRIFRECSELYRTWFRDVPADKRPAVLMIVAGYRGGGQASKEPMIYLLNSEANFAPQLFGQSPCMAGVPQYAVYLVNRYYDPTISRERARALAEYLIAETASQDPKVGGPIKIAEIDPKDGFRALTPEEVDELHEANASLSADLRKFFLTGAA